MSSDASFELLVDADACPVKREVYRVARRYDVPVTLVTNRWMRVPDEPWLELVVVKDEGQMDEADDWIAENTEPNDVVVTDDIVLASRCLEKGGRVIGSRGREFTPESIGEALATRELMADLREDGTVTGGPSAFSKRDRSEFLQTLDRVIQAVMREE
jgi:uncharacterized protein YaiI (UPF0178 family)